MLHSRRKRIKLIRVKTSKARSTTDGQRDVARRSPDVSEAVLTRVLRSNLVEED